MVKVRNARIAAVAAVGLLISPLPALSEASFQGLGDFAGGSFTSFAHGVSADGSVVAGLSYSASGIEAAFGLPLPNLSLVRLIGHFPCPFKSQRYLCDARGPLINELPLFSNVIHKKLRGEGIGAAILRHRNPSRSRCGNHTRVL